MITEYRRLVFSSMDLQKAIVTFSKDKVGILPDGNIGGINIISKPEIFVKIRVADFKDSSKDEEIELDANYLAAAMLYHCIECGIPIPKLATKTLECAGDGLALSMSVNANPQAVDVWGDQGT